MNGPLVSSAPRAPARRARLVEAARYIHVSPVTLANARWRRRRAVPTLRVGKLLCFDLSELDEWLERHRERGLPTGAP